ncbi:MAG: AAA family ATPase [Deltaproteobacteria bacterium]|nr:AAA family ATPase [Deltaproteobacteria bacterium]
MSHSQTKPDPIIALRERNLHMLKLDLTLRNPLRLINDTYHGLLAPGSLGAVLSRSGGGKTALMVQVAMNGLLQERNVLHVSLTDPVEKVALWYRELFTQMTHLYGDSRADQLWEALLRHRLIMTFCSHRFTLATLEERLREMSEQNLFIPDLLIIDGLRFDGSEGPMLQQLKNLAAKLRFHAWCTITTHRHEPSAGNGYPVQMDQVGECFEIILQLKSGEGLVQIRVLKHPASLLPKAPRTGLVLDPTTLLIRDVGI